MSMTGEHREVFMETSSFSGDGGVFLRVFTFTSPITAQNGSNDPGEITERLERGVLGSAAVYQIIDSIIHDMNNYLSGIIGIASLEIGRSSGGISDSCSTIIESAEKLTSLCDDLQSTVAGKEDSALKDLSEEMNLIAEVMRRILPENVHFSITGSCSKMTNVRRDLLRDFIYNLSLNSTEIMSGGGRIRIDVSERVPSGISSMESLVPGKTVCIRYSDGFIMPVTLRDVLSNRQYSLSDVERQFGATVGELYRVCREMAGKIVFERGSGETVLCLLLEGFDRPSRTVSAADEDFDHSPVAGLSVLVADEVDIVLKSTCEFLEHRGMSTMGVSDGDSAMEMLEQHSFDAVVLDLNMPGIPAPTIVRYCQTSFPKMAVIITTGYGMTGTVRDLIKSPSTDSLHKPHRPEVLVDTIYSVLMRIQEGELT